MSHVSPSQTHVGAVDAPLEAGFWGSVCLTCQNFVFGFIGPVFGQAADDGLACSRGLELEFFTTVGAGEPRSGGGRLQSCVGGVGWGWGRDVVTSCLYGSVIERLRSSSF